MEDGTIAGVHFLIMLCYTSHIRFLPLRQRQCRTLLSVDEIFFTYFNQ